MEIFSPKINNALEVTGSSVISGSLEVKGSTFLSGTVSASGDFVPAVNELYNLGSPSLRWKDLYLSGSTIFLGNTKLTTTENGDIEVKDSQTNSLRKIRVDELELGTGENARKISIDPVSGIKFMDLLGNDRTREDIGVTNVISTSGQLTGSFDQRYLLSGSVTQTTWGNIENNPFVSSLTAISASSNIVPSTSATYNLGSSTLRWNIVYTSDLSLRNEHGDWTIVEGEDDLFLYNNKKDKVYKFNLTEVQPSQAPPKKE